MIVIWNSNGEIVEQKTNEDPSDVPRYAVFAESRGLAYFCKDIKSFPEDGWVLDNTGTYRQMSDEEKISANLITHPPEMKIVNGYLVPKTQQELVDDKVITIDSLRMKAMQRITGEITSYLETATTPTNEYPVNDFAQKIVTATMAMKNIADNDADKKAMLSAGLLYSLPRAREVIQFLSEVMERSNTIHEEIFACTTVAQLDAISFHNYL